MKRGDLLKGLAGAAALWCAAACRHGSDARVHREPRRVDARGTFAGFLQSASGGMARGEVMSERAAGTVVRKHLGPPRYDDLVIQFRCEHDQAVFSRPI
jgi:hypothetical protein